MVNPVVTSIVAEGMKQVITPAIASILKEGIALMALNVDMKRVSDVVTQMEAEGKTLQDIHEWMKAEAQVQLQDMKDALNIV